MSLTPRWQPVPQQCGRLFSATYIGIGKHWEHVLARPANFARKINDNLQNTQHPARYSRLTCKILQPLFERANCLNRTCSFQVHQSNEYFARPHLSDECFLIKVGITPTVWHFPAVFCVELRYNIFHVIRQLAHTKIHDFIRYLVIIGSSYVHTIWFINHWCKDNALF